MTNPTMSAEERAAFEATGMTAVERRNEERRKRVERAKAEGWVFVPPDAIRKAEQAAYERAAQVSESYINVGDEYDDSQKHNIAKAIRALAKQPEKVG